MTAPAQPTSSPGPVRRHRVNLGRLRPRVPVGTVRAVWRDIIPVAVALLSLGVSFFTLFEARRAPTVICVLPAVR